MVKSGSIELSIHQPCSQTHSFLWFLTSMTLVIGLSNKVYATEKYIDAAVIHVTTSGDNSTEKHNSITDGDSSRFIAGKIVDQHTRSGLSGATVIVEGGRLAVTTDVNGGFKLFVPDHVTTDTIQLTITSANYFNRTVTYAIKDFPLHVLVELKPEYLLLTLKSVREDFISQLSGKMACCFIREPTVWERLRRRVTIKIKHVFGIKK